MYRFIAKNIRYPDTARRMSVQGKVLISCEVTEDGKLVNERVVEGIGGGCDEEALRMIQLIPDEWIAGIKNGKPVRTKITLPIAFKLG